MKKFNILVIDPPYGFSDKLSMDKVARGADANYGTMYDNDILNLPIKDISADDAILALWVPSSLLSFGLKLMETWGFEQKQTWIWVKVKKSPLESISKFIIKNLKTNNDIRSIFEIIEKDYWFNQLLAFGMGRIGRNVHEIALIGTRGKISSFIKDKSQRTVFFDKVLKHSQKPEILQDNLDKIFPDQSLNRLEIFARRQRKNWTCIGNEAPNTFGEDVRSSIKNLK